MITIIDNILYNGVSLPPDADYFLERPRINAMLEKAIEKPLITVTAGAGYGKTQAVSTLLRTEQNTIWFQLSQLDNLMARFWERFAYGFKSYNKKLSDSLKALGYPESIAAFDKFLHLLAKGLEEKKSFVIVLDDFHLIHDKTVLNFLQNLIDAHIQGFSIILVSRTKPNINLAGMLSKGLLARMTEEDLRFTKDEMIAYYEQQGLALNEKMVVDLYSYTDGWIFAMYLVGLSIKKGAINIQSSISAAKDDIFELIEKEIFSASSERLQRFLVQISILDVLPKGLLMELSDEIAPDGGSSYDVSIVTEMMGISQFISYDSFFDSYRIHHLFREFLLERKNRLTSMEIAQIHLAAAKWYEKNNFKLEAIDHYKKCNCYSEIFDIILSIDRHVPQETADLLIKLIEAAPNELLQAKPIMHVVKAYYLLNNNQISKAYGQLTSLQKKCESMPHTVENRSILGEVYIVLALISIINQNFEFEELFKKADEFLPGGSTLVDYQLNIAEGINITGIKSPVAGELNKYFDALFRTMPYASRVMNGCNYGAEYLNAADSYFMTGDIRSAEKNAYEAISRAEQKQQYGIVCMANFILVRIYTLKGDHVKVDTVLKQMKNMLDNLQTANSLPLYDIIEGWFYNKIGETDKISKWIRYEEQTREMLPPVVVGREYLVRSDCLLVEGRYDELMAFMEQTDVMYSERGILYAVIQNKITKAIINHYIGNYEASMNALNESYALSSPNHLIIQYIEYGNQMRTLIGAAKRSQDCKIPMDWLNSIYTKSSSYAKQLANIIAQNNQAIHGPQAIKLSTREYEILNYLCRGLTRKEIADSCNLSTNTIKSILQSLYNKLGAVNSADAVHIAGVMGLIDDKNN